jgi:hypothetical protein
MQLAWIGPDWRRLAGRRHVLSVRRSMLFVVLCEVGDKAKPC